MSSHALYTSLLRLPIIHILRAAGFHATRPAVLDTLVDLAARYLTVLASQTAAHAYTNHNELSPTITDVRMALQDVGALWPQKTLLEEDIAGQEDMRGIEEFLAWMTGEEHREIRRIAGLEETEAGIVGINGPTEKEDFLMGRITYHLVLIVRLILLFISAEEETQPDRRGIKISGNGSRHRSRREAHSY